MSAKYRIEIELVLNEGAASIAIELARNVYLRRGGARTVEDGIDREVSQDEFIDSTEQALLELVEGHLLGLPGIEIDHENCKLLGPEVEAARCRRTEED